MPVMLATYFLQYTCTYAWDNSKAIANNLVDQVLVDHYYQGKNIIPCYKKQVINKSTWVS